LGVTSKFAQIFLRDDKDLTGKQSRDLKKAYVTSVFEVRGISKILGASEPRIDLRGEIPYDSSTRWVKYF
jgi:hypothetical protein